MSFKTPQYQCKTGKKYEFENKKILKRTINICAILYSLTT